MPQGLFENADVTKEIEKAQRKFHENGKEWELTAWEREEIEM